MLIPFAEIVAKTGVDVRGMRVLHCGACELEELDAYHQAGITNVVWIEARPATVKAMHVKYPKETIVQACIAQTTGQYVLFKETAGVGKGMQSSMFPIVKEQMLKILPDLVIKSTYRLRTTRLDDLMAEQKMDPQFDFLNVDLQGAELQALRSLSDEMWATLKIVYVEVEKVAFYKFGPTEHEVDSFLRAKGFARVASSWALSPDNEPLFGDVVYVRQS
jgi:FkbM family methyltransferase